MKQVGNYVHNMEMCFWRPCCGIHKQLENHPCNSSYWSLYCDYRGDIKYISPQACIIDSIFLHRLAEQIQDAYPEAVSIAEKVWNNFSQIPYIFWISIMVQILSELWVWSNWSTVDRKLYIKLVISSCKNRRKWPNMNHSTSFPFIENIESS